MNNPLVSIIVPCYRQAQFLDDALKSVLVQTYTNWECIIVNDGSPDNTEVVASKWIEIDSRFKYHFQENGGLSNARNAGIRIGQGEYILPLDADDKISKSYVELALKAFQEDHSLKVIYCKAEKFGEESGIWNLETFSLFNLSQKNMIFCSALFRKKDWQLVGGYDPNMIYGWEDWEFWISILKNGGGVKCVDEIGFYYRVKQSSMLNKIDRDRNKYLFEYLSVKHADFFVKQLGSFRALSQEIININREYEINLKSEKFVIDLFCKRFFGFSVFGKYK